MGVASFSWHDVHRLYFSAVNWVKYNAQYFIRKSSAWVVEVNCPLRAILVLRFFAFSLIQDEGKMVASKRSATFIMWVRKPAMLGVLVSFDIWVVLTWHYPWVCKLPTRTKFYTFWYWSGFQGSLFLGCKFAVFKILMKLC